jgi:hypothetical protein
VQNALDELRYHDLEHEKVEWYLRQSELVIRDMIGYYGPFVTTRYFYNTLTTFS